MLIHSLYTVQRIKEDDTLHGNIHGSDDARETLCEKELNHNWYILNNTFDGEITCGVCISTFKKEKNEQY